MQNQGKLMKHIRENGKQKKNSIWVIQNRENVLFYGKLMSINFLHLSQQGPKNKRTRTVIFTK